MAVNNKDALYHRLDEITGHYDAIILCHILEHVSFNECCSIVEWCKDRTDRLIIVLPCTTNVVMNAIFDSDLEHKDKYDNDDFIQILEECGYSVRVSRCDIVGYDKQNILKVLFRFGLNYALGLSPFFCYVMECETSHAR
jgi:hypothetical protein